MKESIAAGHDLARLRQVALRVAGSVLPFSGHHEAEDVAQESLADFVQYSSAHEVENAEALIVTMARRRALKYRRRWIDGPRKRDAIDGAVDENVARGHVAADIPRSPRTQERFESLEALEWAISELEPKLRAVAELAFLGANPGEARTRGRPVLLADRCDTTEIAERLGLAEGTVRNRMVKVRDQLQALLWD